MRFQNRILAVWVILFATCLALQNAVGQSTGWTGAKLKNASGSYGSIARGGTGIEVQGSFADRARVYQMLAEQGAFMKLSDGQKSGWVFRLNLTPVQAAASDVPKLQAGDQLTDTVQYPMVGQRVFWKDGAVAMVGNRTVEMQLIDWPASVGKVQGEWLWLGRAWVRLTDVRRLQETVDFYAEEVRRNPQNHGDRHEIGWHHLLDLPLAA